MKPTSSGIYEWFDENGTTRHVIVCDVCKGTGLEPWLRVYFGGGYYNVHDEEVGTPDEEFSKAEWPDRWGNRIGDENPAKLKDCYTWFDK